jgi:hypothetical protein
LLATSDWSAAIIILFNWISTNKIMGKNLIDDPRINERVSHSDRRGKFLKKMTNWAPLHKKLYYTFVPLHIFFFVWQIEENLRITLIFFFYCLILKKKSLT